MGFKELSQEEILEIKQAAKDSQVLSPSAEFVEYRKKVFEEIDAASTGSEVFPRLHKLAETLSGEPHEIIVFDTIELAVGPAFPVGTRYAVPMSIQEIGMSEEEIEKGMDELLLPDLFPGFVIRSWPAGGTTIQFGIDLGADAHKIGPRLEFIASHWRNGKSFSSPYWWNYDIAAQDITQEYDFGILRDLATALIYSDNLDTALKYFTVGGETYKSNPHEVDYTKMNRETKKTETVWKNEENENIIKAGFDLLETYYK